MRRRIIIITIIIIICFCLTAFVNHRVETNLQKNYGISQKIYKIGDVVPFGMDDTQDGPMDGYSICVDDAQIIEYSEFMELLELNPESDLGSTAPDKVCFITTTLSNSQSIYEGPYLANMVLHGNNFILTLDKPLTALANPFFKEAMDNNILSSNLHMDSLGVSVSENSSATVRIVYDLHELSFTKHTWNNIMNEELYLTITFSPTEKSIQIN